MAGCYTYWHSFRKSKLARGAYVPFEVDGGLSPLKPSIDGLSGENQFYQLGDFSALSLKGSRPTASSLPPPGLRPLKVSLTAVAFTCKRNYGSFTGTGDTFKGPLPNFERFEIVFRERTCMGAFSYVCRPVVRRRTREVKLE